MTVRRPEAPALAIATLAAALATASCLRLIGDGRLAVERDGSTPDGADADRPGADGDGDDGLDGTSDGDEAGGADAAGDGDEETTPCGAPGEPGCAARPESRVVAIRSLGRASKGRRG